MILGIDDIAGGATILSILRWLGLSLLFYIACYLAVINIIDDFTKNSPIKLPVMLLAALPSALAMNLFNYDPLMLAILMGISNFHRVKDLSAPDNKRFAGLTIKKGLFYTSSYLYIVTVCFLAYYLRQSAILH
jgi:hypothetical protein